jgi:hypothetical protein
MIFNGFRQPADRDLMSDYPHKRAAQRTKVAVPVALENGTGVTRDISQTGVYLKTSAAFTPGDTIRLTLELEYAVPDGPMQFQCVGRVVRVEKLGEEYGIASTIDEMNTLH